MFKGVEAASKFAHTSIESTQVVEHLVAGVFGEALRLFQSLHTLWEVMVGSVGVAHAEFLSGVHHACGRCILCVMMCHRFACVVGLAGVSCSLNSVAWAQDALSGVSPATLTVAHAVFSDTDSKDAAPALAFGKEGSKWWSAGATAGHDFADSTDVGGYAAFTYFIIDDVEVTGQAGVRYYSQPGDDAVGLAPQVLFRWHFVNTGAWTVFAEAGIGVMASSDNVPFDGTSFNFVPRLGVGVTRRLTDDDTRLIAGLTWAHVSNARIQGDGKNPSRDEPMVYVGVIWRF